MTTPSVTAGGNSKDLADWSGNVRQLMSNDDKVDKSDSATSLSEVTGIPYLRCPLGTWGQCTVLTPVLQNAVRFSHLTTPKELRSLSTS